MLASDSRYRRQMTGFSTPGGERAVLEDTRGLRGRWMRRFGRTLSLLLAGWLVVLVAGGLGLTPLGDLPFQDVLRPSKGPKPLNTLPEPKEPSPEDLRPALPQAPASVAPTASEVESRGRAAPGARARGVKAKAPRRRPRAPGQRSPVRGAAPPVAPAAGTTTSPGRSAEAPGQVRTTTPGKSGSVPGQTGTTPGQSATAPGQAKKTTTTTTTTTVTTTTTTTVTRTIPGRSKRP
jgi:hypothetical protein